MAAIVIRRGADFFLPDLKTLGMEVNGPPSLRVVPSISKCKEPGDRLTDATGAWEVLGQPHSTAGGKNARVRVQRVAELRCHHLYRRGARTRRSA